MTTWVGFLSDSMTHFVSENGQQPDDLSPNYVELYRNLYDHLERHPVVKMPVDATTTTLSYGALTRASSNYSDQSYKSRIVGGGSGSGNNVKATLTRSTFQGMECEADKAAGNRCPHTVKNSHKVSMQDDHQPDPTRFREIRHGNACDVSSLNHSQ